MILRDIPKNDNLVKRLEHLGASEKLSHAYIIQGDAFSDKTLFVNCFIKGIFCSTYKGIGCEHCISCKKIEHGNHEDLVYVESNGKNIKDESIEALQERLKKKPFFGHRNIAVIKDADTMTLRAQNRLLKTLEEPPHGTILFLLLENVDNIVDTILSRCIIFKINSFKNNSNENSIERAQLLIKMLLDKEPYYALKSIINEYAAQREDALLLLDAMELIYGDLVINPTKENRNYKRNDIYRAVSLIEEARRDLHQGIATGYAMKNLVIKIGG